MNQSPKDHRLKLIQTLGLHDLVQERDKKSDERRTGQIKLRNTKITDTIEESPRTTGGFVPLFLTQNLCLHKFLICGPQEQILEGELNEENKNVQEVRWFGVVISYLWVYYTFLFAPGYFRVNHLA
jgi:hypothetical protein